MKAKTEIFEAIVDVIGSSTRPEILEQGYETLANGNQNIYTND